MAALIYVIIQILELYLWLIIIGAVLSWLVAFDVINRHNRFVFTVSDLCHRLTEPLLRRLRRFIPSVNGIDLSPLAAIFIIIFLQRLLADLMLG